MTMRMRQVLLGLCCASMVAVCCAATSDASSTFGPWNVSVLEGGVGFDTHLPASAAVLAPNAQWTLFTWVKLATTSGRRQLIAGFGESSGKGRYFMLDENRLGFWPGHDKPILSSVSLQPGVWYFIAAEAHDQRLRLFVNGHEVASGPIRQVGVAPVLRIGPLRQPWARATHFAGKVAGLTLQSGQLAIDQLDAMASHVPGQLTRYLPASPHWPVQTKQMAGQVVPQPPSTLPTSRAPFPAPQAHVPGAHPKLARRDDLTWVLGDWKLASARKLGGEGGATLSEPAYAGGKAWMVATVPGTVLTTLVDRGIYPDPSYGLDNMAIPESLHQHDWWYRTQFRLPADLGEHHLQLTFNGINYAAQVWVNGKQVGRIKGAFIRGRFDVTGLLHPGRRNAIAVRISPPPDPGVPHEQSLKAGPGPNGGMLALDGPTFIASEGWDWIPAIRDRDAGLWQEVTLHANGAVRLGDPRVVTHLPVPDLSRADVDIDVPLDNSGTKPVRGTLHATFGTVSIHRVVTVPPGGTVVRLRPSNSPQLVVHHPHLWWPNGYGKAYLYRLRLRFDVHGTMSDKRSLHFGIRQISYELSLFDNHGRLRRVLVTPDATRAPGTRLVDVTHEGIRKTPTGWAYSLLPSAMSSPAVRSLEDKRLSPYLAIRVNGVRIAIKGGSWGTDDFIKRTSRQRLEPYFKLQKQAHLDVVRNWVGQSTEPVFYDLADKYGLLVFNDFWQSTQNYNLEPMDDALFMRNAADVIRRYRNHPCIALWFGRNEGVPQPLLNQRLDKAVAALDGTRLYLPSSNDINLWTSGPYNYRAPESYFTELAKGFAMEVGTPSFPTLEAFKAMMPKADRWPISDDWAYHDWHQSGNGDVHSFEKAMRIEFGAPTSLADFTRKAQMMDYVTYRAIFEGFNAHLWTQNSGRLLWMSHPSWPSTTWQIYSHDYDTQASYYGVKEAAQPIHVQMNLPDRRIAVINNTTRPLSGAKLDVHVYDLDGATLVHDSRRVDAGAVAATAIDTGINLNRLVRDHRLIFVALTLTDADGRKLSRNFYWTAARPSDLRRLNRLPPVTLTTVARRQGTHAIRVLLENPTRRVALAAKLTLVDSHGRRILPAYYTHNYVSLAPGQSQSITVSAEDGTDLSKVRINLRGWNLTSGIIPVM